MNMLALIPVLIMVQASYFDMNGTIKDVMSPNEMLIDNKTIKLADVDASGLTSRQYLFLMNDIEPWLVGKDVFVKDSRVYFDLQGSYNSISINEMIQKEITNIEENWPYWGPYWGWETLR